MKSKNLNLSDLSKRFLKVLDEKNISGYRLSKDVDEITESKLTFIRTGRNEPSKILINALLNKFTDISRIWLLTGEGEMFKNSEREVNDNEIEYNIIENTNGNKFIKMPDGSLMIKVPLIPFNAYASFLEVYEDEYQVHQEFESTYFTVDKVGRGRYVAFTVKNDSMNGGSLDDTPSGAQVLARELGRQHWKDGFKTTRYGWIIICTTGIFHKDIVDLNSNNGEITCSSRNHSPEFPNFKINLNGVHSIYKVIKRTF